MKFTSDIKKMLKKTYKSMKKGLNSFLTTLGFNKKETYDLSQKISENIHKEISEYYQNKGVDEETKKSFNAVMLELKMENEMNNQKMDPLKPTLLYKNDKYAPIAELDKQSHNKEFYNNLQSVNNDFNSIDKGNKKYILGGIEVEDIGPDLESDITK